MSKYRIENKENVNFNGRKTSFKVYEKIESSRGFVYAGNYFAKGSNATDEECTSCYIEESSEEGY